MILHEDTTLVRNAAAALLPSGERCYPPVVSIIAFRAQIVKLMN